MLHALLLLGLTSLLLSSEINIGSTLINNHGETINNVNIICGDNGTTSDKNGVFKITCNKNDIIHISHIQYKEISIPINQISTNG